MENYTLTTSQDEISRDRERIKKNGEVFTPTTIIERMMDMVDNQSIWSNPSKTFLDPTCGNGNILIGMLKRRLANGVSPKDAVSTLYGVELMQDNVEKCWQRVSDEIGTHEFDDIIKHNIVCSDFFKWNLDPEDWRPKTEQELKEEELVAKKKKQERKKANKLF